MSEESKVKTAEEITHEAFKYYLENSKGLSNKAFADGATWMQNELQSHIAKLEARNKELEEGLIIAKKIFIDKDLATPNMAYLDYFNAREKIDKALKNI